MLRPDPTPRVSVAFPVYNGERTAREALESLAAQTYRDFEVLIFDNASQDRTPEICQAFAREHPNVVYRRNERNLGAAGNYNLALRTARGRYFKWMACDDVLEPRFLEACVECFDRGPEDLVLVFPKRRFIDPEGAPHADCHFEAPREVRVGGRSYRELSYGELVRYPHGRGRLRNIAPAVVFGLMRRDAALRTRGIGGFIGADLVFNAEMALLGRLWQVPEVLWRNRMHAADSWRARLSIEEQAAWYNPGSKRGARHRELVLLTEYLRSIARLEHRPWVAASRIRDVAALAVAMARRALRRRAARLPLAALEASPRSALPARLWLLARRAREGGLAGISGAIRDVRALPDERVLAEILAPRLARRDPRAHALLARWLREPGGVQQRAAEIALRSGGAPTPADPLLSIAPGGASMGTDGS